MLSTSDSWSWHQPLFSPLLHRRPSSSAPRSSPGCSRRLYKRRTRREHPVACAGPTFPRGTKSCPMEMSEYLTAGGQGLSCGIVTSGVKSFFWYIIFNSLTETFSSTSSAVIIPGIRDSKSPRLGGFVDSLGMSSTTDQFPPGAGY